jgi:hypothetical protein
VWSRKLLQGGFKEFVLRTKHESRAAERWFGLILSLLVNP